MNKEKLCALLNENFTNKKKVEKKINTYCYPCRQSIDLVEDCKYTDPDYSTSHIHGCLRIDSIQGLYLHCKGSNRYKFRI